MSDFRSRSRTPMVRLSGRQVVRLWGGGVVRSTRQPANFFLGALLLFALPSQSIAQAPASAIRLRDSAIALIATAYRAGDDRGLETASALLDRGLAVAPNDAWLLHYAGFALYRRATLAMGRDGANIKPLLEKADDHFQRSAAAARIPESHALRSSVLGMMIGSNPLRGMTLGPRSSSEIEKAVELGPENPRVWLMRGIGAMNTPAMFGGGLGKAEEYLKRSITLFATDKPEHPAPSWGRHEAHIWLGQVYAKQDRVADARAEYQKALAIEPDDQWVKMILLPALDRKQGSDR